MIQGLFAIGLAMRSTQHRTTSPVVSERLTAHLDDLNQVILQIRTAIVDLHSATRTSGLRAAMTDQIVEITTGCAIRTTVRMSGPLNAVPADIAHHAVAVLREAVTNVVRHSDAAAVTVSLVADDALTVVVTDDGLGIPDGIVPSGLRNMADRAVAEGGSCRVSVPAGGGTRIAWTAPLAPAVAGRTG